MSQPEATPASSPSIEPKKYRSNFRWVILGLLFFATTINYLDRSITGILAPTLQQKFGISEMQYGEIQSVFAIAYACGQFFAGAVLDAIGVRTGFALALIAWSVASMLHALGNSAGSFRLARAL